MVVNLDHFVKVIKYIKPPASSVCDMCIFPPSDDLYHIQKPSNRYRSSDISQVENKTKQLPSPSKQISATKSVVIHQNWSSKIDSPQKNSPQSCFHDELRPRFVNFWNWNVSESWQNETTLFGGIDNKSLCFFDLGGPFLENILWPLHHKLKKKRHLKIPKKKTTFVPQRSLRKALKMTMAHRKTPPRRHHDLRSSPDVFSGCPKLVEPTFQIRELSKTRWVWELPQVGCDCMWKFIPRKKSSQFDQSCHVWKIPSFGRFGEVSPNSCWNVIGSPNKIKKTPQVIVTYK